MLHYWQKFGENPRMHATDMDETARSKENWPRHRWRQHCWAGCIRQLSVATPHQHYANGSQHAASTIIHQHHWFTATLYNWSLIVAFLKLTASSRLSAPPNDSPKCLGFCHWLTWHTLNIHLLTYLLTYQLLAVKTNPTITRLQSFVFCII